MLKLAISNIWNRRSRYGWLFIELIIVCVLSWIVLDRFVVLTWQYNLPLGYDADLLVAMELEDVNPDDETFVSGRWEKTEDDFYELLGYVRSLAEVDKATLGFNEADIEQCNSSYFGYSDAEGNWFPLSIIRYVPGQDYFTTYGLKGDGGVDNAEYLSSLEGPGMMITSRAAAILFPGKNPFMACDSLLAIYEAPPNADSFFSPATPLKLLALVGECRPSSTIVNSFGVRSDAADSHAVGNRIVMRLHKNVDRDKFVAQLIGRIDEFRRGNIRAVLVRSHQEIISLNRNRETGPERRLDRIFSVFFLLNVCLGVTGTFWMMTRKRASEVGVLRAFGSTPGQVRVLLMLEATVLAFCSWLIGCGLYLIYARRSGLFFGISDDFSHTWVESFPLHFAVISVIILILLFLAVAVGMAGPGWKLSRVNPVDALRSE